MGTMAVGNTGVLILILSTILQLRHPTSVCYAQSVFADIDDAPPHRTLGLWQTDGIAHHSTSTPPLGPCPARGAVPQQRVAPSAGTPGMNDYYKHIWTSYPEFVSHTYLLELYVFILILPYQMYNHSKHGMGDVPCFLNDICTIFHFFYTII
jgi:hypothetical protein